jgi:PAS domain S-box-containing protein
MMLRRSGIEIVGEVPWGTHFCQFYETSRDLVETIVPYFREGLLAGEFCMWITSEPLKAEEARAALKAAVPDLDRRIENGQIEILDYDRWYVRGGIFSAGEVLRGWVDKLASARAGGFEGLRLAGDASWLEKTQWKDFAAYEEAANEIIGRYPMLALGTYSLEKCGAPEIMDVVSNHRFALIQRQGRWEIVESSEQRTIRRELEAAEEAVLRTKQEWERTFDSVPDLIAILDDRHRIVRANKAMAARLSTTPEQCVGRICFDCVHGTTSPPDFCPHALTMRDGKEHAAEIHEDRLGGDFLVSTTPIIDDQGRMTGSVHVARDISEFKAAERELAYLASFPKQNPNPVVEIDGEGNVRYANPGAIRLFPDLKEKAGHHPWLAGWEEIGRALDAEPSGAQVREIAVADVSYQQSFSAVGPGPLIRIYGLDITRRKRMEEALRESERRLNRAEEIAHLGSWELDLGAGRLSWSDEVYRIFGLRPREFAATYEAFLEAVHPDDRAAVDAAYSGSLREGRDSYEIEHRVIRKSDGAVRNVHEKCEHIRDESGRIIRSIGMVHDVTERRLAEEALRRLAEEERLRLAAAVEQAAESIITADLGGTIRYVNSAFERINRRSRDEVLGASYFALLGDVPLENEIRGVFARGETWNGSLTRASVDARDHELNVTMTPVRDASGKILNFLIVERDVTQEVRLQRHVRQAQKVEALGTLAGGIAHDFNNILSTIVINTELALLGLDERHPAREALPVVLHAVQRGKELVKQIITFSRHREQDRRPMKVRPIVKETLKFLRASVPASVEIREDIGSEPDLVLADPSHIHQILMNLCNNSAQAMREKGGLLEVRVRGVDVDAAMVAAHPDLRPGPHLRLTVSDSGCGMTRDVMERIFDPFFTTKKPGEGTGLGLSVVHGIVRGYGGAITVYSRPGRGSTFNVYLPRVAGKPDEETAPPEAPAGGKERILLVEDEEIQLRSLEALLRKLGYRVTAASNGLEALSLFRADPSAFDLALTDQTMPQMTGAKLAEALFETRPGFPVVLCTGFSEVINGDEARSLGIREFVMKPFSVGEVAQAIRRALKGEEKG